jgi:hypothetical protein
MPTRIEGAGETACDQAAGKLRSALVKTRQARPFRARLGLSLLAVATCFVLPSCAHQDTPTTRANNDNVAISRSQYDAEGHGFEESWPFGPLRNSASGDFR